MPRTGETKWVFDPKVYENGLGIPANDGWLHRGVAYWRSGDDERVVILTAFAHMIALDAKTGKPVPTLRHERPGRPCRRPAAAGRPRLLHHDLAAGDRARRDRGRLICHGLVGTAGRRRRATCAASTCVTGRLLWTFNTVPQAGEPGVETWEKESWKEAGNANVWAPMSADEELGYVYLPVSTPTNDYYGGHRPGDGLYGDSLVCLDAATGKKDMALPARPARLVGLRHAGGAQSDRHHRRRTAASRRWRRSPSRPLSMFSIASPASRSGRSRTGRCRPPAFPAKRLRKPSRFRRDRRRSTSRACARRT